MTITERRRRGVAAENVIRQERAELRADEIASVHEIGTDYAKVDRAGDLEMETALSRLYQLADDDEERSAVAAVYVVWQRTEQREDGVLSLSVEEAVSLLKANNGVWLGEGAK